MFEHHQKNLVPFPVFLRRLAASILMAAVLAAIALFIGIGGYHWIAGLPWIDSLLNASMILGGMGPVDTLTSDRAKLFASGYALFSGLIFIGIMGLVMAPIAHRMLHAFHADESDVEK